MLTEQQINLMYEEAKKARELSYSPYSHFKVGACILLKSGKTISGSNVENASYGLTCCAERNTLFQTYNKGYRKEDILGLLIIGDTEGPVSPCGACRQVISELMEKDAPVIMANLHKDLKEVTVNDLLPYAFSDEDL